MLGKIKCQETPGKELPILQSSAREHVPAVSVCLGPSFGRRVQFRQGLWITDLQTPPGQECSNGSMLCVAVVL